MVPPVALFEPVDDGCWLPTALARGPWDPGALHGGPVAALVARAVEQVPTPGAPEPMHPVHLTLELLRPVPLEPLTVTAAVVRPGRRVQLVEVTVAVAASGTAVTRGLALRIRENPAAHVDAADVSERNGERIAAEDRPPPAPAAGSAPAAFFLPHLTAVTDLVAFHSHGVEHRFVEGRFDEPGPSTDWIRLAVPVVPGETPSGWQRAVAAADFGNGVSGVLDPDRFTFINPDLTVFLARQPRGEWVCLRAATRPGTDGVAVAESTLFDEHGRIGRSVQTLLVAPR